MVVSKEIYEREIEKIAPKLEKLKGRPFDEIMKGLDYDIRQSSIPWDLVFALTYVLDSDRFFIEVDRGRGYGYRVKFAADTTLRGLTTFVYRGTLSDKMPTEKEARDFVKKYLAYGVEVEGLLEKAKEVVDTCKVIQT